MRSLTPDLWPLTTDLFVAGHELNANYIIYYYSNQLGYSYFEEVRNNTIIIDYHTQTTASKVLSNFRLATIVHTVILIIIDYVILLYNYLMECEWTVVSPQYTMCRRLKSTPHQLLLYKQHKPHEQFIMGKKKSFSISLIGGKKG